MNKIVVGIGEILFDLLPSGKALGGAPANFAYHVNRLGCDGYAVSAIGDDELGREIVDGLSDKIHLCLETVGYPTGVVEVELDNRGVPSYTIIEDVAWDNIPFSNTLAELASKANAVCFGTLAQRSAKSRQSIMQFIDLMPKDGLKVYDINLRQHFYSKDIISDSLQIANILKINDEELVVVAKLFEIEGEAIDICKYLIDKFDLKIVILTKGSEGSVVVSNDMVSELKSPKVEVVDTVGAGDAFTAAFVVSYLRGDSIAEAHCLANNIAAEVCTKKGAMS